MKTETASPVYPALHDPRVETLDQRELRDRGIAPGVRIGSCIRPWSNGTVTDVTNALRVHVVWDSGPREIVAWTEIAAL